MNRRQGECRNRGVPGICSGGPPSLPEGCFDTISRAGWWLHSGEPSWGPQTATKGRSLSPSASAYRGRAPGGNRSLRQWVGVHVYSAVTSYSSTSERCRLRKEKTGAENIGFHLCLCLDPFPLVGPESGGSYGWAATWLSP